MKTLIVLAHPDMENGSIANKVVIDRVKGMAGVEIRDLYRIYPDFKFDVEAEQAALSGADLIIFQFPFFWYSVPGIMKEWLDQVFTYGFAFGSKGRRLKGKDLLISTTVGGGAAGYQPGEYNNFPVRDLLKPLEQTANLTGMIYNEPLITYDLIYIPGVYNEKSEVEQRAGVHADKLQQFISDKTAGRSGVRETT